MPKIVYELEPNNVPKDEKPRVSWHSWALVVSCLAGIATSTAAFLTADSRWSVLHHAALDVWFLALFMNEARDIRRVFARRS